MKVISVGEFKEKMAFFIERILKGEEFIVSYGRKKNKIFKISPISKSRQFKRKLGSLEGKATLVIGKDWKITDEELLKL
ncbi:MAG: prevent-host-death protein [Flammeovirgaceae bacterium]|nr:MAG: prevent-host-death protein [Flammeovirgaceae bacterium]